MLSERDLEFNLVNIGKTMYVNFYVFMIRLCISIQRFYRKKDLSHVLMIFMREQHILSLKILLNQLRDRAKSLSELEHEIQGISQKMLLEQLKELQVFGLVEKKHIRDIRYM